MPCLRILRAEIFKAIARLIVYSRHPYWYKSLPSNPYGSDVRMAFLAFGSNLHKIIGRVFTSSREPSRVCPSMWYHYHQKTAKLSLGG